ncbi:hypothetical protein EG68_07678 [Paragonimus skrjabini miyazakii]|uniref:FYVE-type domain-containing protein n=1 Tax=Paragonimus skrjabini miyazakii TaxID=59628 RepID=A0A8S9Y9D4_9TREM|nr:hypothetical protein EG68_07678 [Paragonimus skrjabini miyazakii]
MSSDNVGLVSKLNIESPPTVVHRGRISSSDVPIYKTSNEFSDPPGVPVSPLTGSVRQLPSDTGTDMSMEFGAVQLVDEKEQLMFEDCEAFVEQLGCPMDQPVKVVAVVGNTGDGKSYTMNHTFFHGTQVFATSPSQTTCTMGVWAAFVPSKSCILLDTEVTSFYEPVNIDVSLDGFGSHSLCVSTQDCYALGIKNIVVPKAGDSVFDAARFLYSGYVLECKRHGIIYKSRSLWSSNAEPEDTARVHWEVVHVWSGEKTLLQGVHPFSQIIMDGLNTVTRQVSELAGPPVRLLGDLFADSLAPEYWQPNATIRMCAICKFEFPSPSVDGVDYDSLAKRKVTVEPTGEHRTNAEETTLVLGPGKSGKPMRGTPLLPRTFTLTPLSLEEGKDTTGLTPMSKPTAISKKELIDTDKHHCRACGRGVCGACSTGSLPVPGFGPGMLGTTLNQNQHRRLLLKVFAVADVVIYLTKAPRLHTDMFTFLADASDSFAQHFRPDLEALAKRTGLPWSAGQLGPAVIVFQETRHTDPLDGPYKTTSNAPNTHSVFLESTGGSSKPASNPVSAVLQNRLADMKRNVDSFSAMHYIGIQTKDGPTDFKPLSLLTSKLLKDNSVRAPRKVEHVFCSLHLLNTRFATDIPATGQYTFVEEYFTCPVTCDSCSARCCLSVGHTTGRHQARSPASSDQPSDTPTGCRCYTKRRGRRVSSPHADSKARMTETQLTSNPNNVYTGRKALEMYSVTVNSVPPVFSMFKDTLKGFVRPDYWTPDHLCKMCALCDRPFGPSRHIHHCRACGRGVCQPCSPHRQPVPLRGLDLPHRVCNDCFRPNA